MSIPTDPPDPSAIPWPAKGSQLFVDGSPDWKNNAYIYLEPDWTVVSVGYRMASDLLAESVENDGELADPLVDPIIFGYRHAVEASLKHLITETGTNPPPTHDIAALWKLARAGLAPYVTGTATDDLDAVEEMILQLDVVDSNSFEFRYPIDKKGQPTGQNAGRRVNVRHLRESIEPLFNWFGGAISLVMNANANAQP